MPIGAAAALVAATAHKAGMEARGTSIPALISMRTALSMALATHGVSVLRTALARIIVEAEATVAAVAMVEAVATVEAVVEVVIPPMVPTPGTTSPIKLILVILAPNQLSIQSRWMRPIHFSTPNHYERVLMRATGELIQELDLTQI